VPACTHLALCCSMLLFEFVLHVDEGDGHTLWVAVIGLLHLCMCIMVYTH
jgi:hypothetical protein